MGDGGLFLTIRAWIGPLEEWPLGLIFGTELGLVNHQAPKSLTRWVTEAWSFWPADCHGNLNGLSLINLNPFAFVAAAEQRRTRTALEAGGNARIGAS
jgi:hypothetical protein